MSKHLRRFASLWLTVLIGTVSGAADAGAPPGIAYQGLGVAADGSPLDGTHDLEVRIYDDALSSAPADQVYRENHLATSFVDGVFSVVIGAGSSPSAAFGASLFDTTNLWLELQIDGETLAPRTKLQSVPYALHCARADSATNATNSVNATHAVTATDSSSAQTAVTATSATNAATAQNALQLGGIAAAQYVLGSDARLSDARPPLAGSPSYIQNGTAQQVSSSFNISGSGTAAGTLTANVVSATTQYNIGLSRVLFSPGSFNFFAGPGAGQVTSTGTADSFFGVNAGIFNSTGSNNAFFGFEAGRNNNAGGSNSFFGKDAGRSNTTGSDNSFFGIDAGQTSTTASGNSFFGASAGASNTTGANHAFFGFEAGLENEAAFNNSFFGYKAGRANVIGLNNSFFGFEAGVANTGSRNSFFGSGAGHVSAQALHNSFFGGQAGGANTTGDDNSFFGLDSGLTNTTGSLNTAIGSAADVSSAALSNATAIGARAQVGQSNALVLGSISGVNGATATVNVGIGTTTPQNRLHVDGIIRVDNLGLAGTSSLCRNASNQISSCSSSLRYKTNLAHYAPGLELIARLEPISFDWKDGGPRDLGLGAETVASVEPLLVTRNAKGEIEGVKYDRIGVVLVNAVQQQQAQIERLTRALCALKPGLELCD